MKSSKIAFPHPSTKTAITLSRRVEMVNLAFRSCLFHPNSKSKSFTAFTSSFLSFLYPYLSQFLFFDFSISFIQIKVFLGQSKFVSQSLIEKKKWSYTSFWFWPLSRYGFNPSLFENQRNLLTPQFTHHRIFVTEATYLVSISHWNFFQCSIKENYSEMGPSLPIWS